MINPLPLLFGSQPTPNQTNGAGGEIIPDQAKAAGNTPQNPFSQLLRAQTTVASLLQSLQVPGSAPEQQQLTQLALLTQQANLGTSVNSDQLPRQLSDQLDESFEGLAPELLLSQLPGQLEEGPQVLSPEQLPEILRVLPSSAEPSSAIPAGLSRTEVEGLVDTALRLPVAVLQPFQTEQAPLDARHQAEPTQNRAKDIPSVSIPSDSSRPVVLQGQPPVAGLPQARVTRARPTRTEWPRGGPS